MFALLILSGCLQKFYNPIGLTQGSFVPSKSFSGVKTEEGTNYIVVHVHGISCHDPGYSTYFQKRLASRLGFSPAPDGNIDVYRYDPAQSEWTASIEPDIFQALYDSQQQRTAQATRATVQKKAKPKDIVVKDVSGLRPSKYSEYFHCPGTRPKKYLAQGEPVPISRQELERYSGSATQPTLIVRRYEPIDPQISGSFTHVEMSWSQLAEAIKEEKLNEELKSDFSDRAIANDLIKSVVLNDKISDAIFYLGPGGEEIRKVMRAALCLAAAGAQNDELTLGTKQNVSHPCLKIANADKVQPGLNQDRQKLILFSESVGSRVLFDTIVDHRQVLEAGIAKLDGQAKQVPGVGRSEEADVVQGFDLIKPNILERNPTFFMFANQLPLLDIALAERSSERSFAALPEDYFAAQYAQENGELHFRLFNNVKISEGLKREVLDHYKRCSSVALNDDETDKFDASIAKNALLNIRNQFELAPELDADWLTEARVSKLKGHVEQSFEEVMDLSIFNSCVEFESAMRSSFKDQLRSPQGAPEVENLMSQTRRWAYDASDRLTRSDGWNWYVAQFRLSRAMWYLRAGEGALRKNKHPENINQILFDTYRDAYSAINGTLTLVAFSDRNDILSYEFSGDYGQRNFGETLDVINIAIRLRNPLLPIKGRAGLIADPLGVHVNHKYSEEILNLIVCGVEEGVSLQAAADRQCS